MAKTADYGIGEFTYPRGWFMIAESSEATNKPTSLTYFGEEMVMYRGESGRVVLIEAYCPHMGTHFAKNETSYVVTTGKHIDGDGIRCPYHGWRFNPEGQCDDIPYSPAPIPKTACVKSWPTREWGGCIFMWYDPENGQPDYELPDLPEWEDPAWVNWKIDHLGVLECHPQEIIDNMTDKAHLGPIHGSKDMEYFENEINDHVIVQRLAAGHETLAEGVMYNDTWYTGPSILLSRMLGDHPSLMLITHTPVEDGVVRAWHALLVKSPNAEATEEDTAVARQYQEASRLAFLQDFEIWANKKPCLQIMQVVGDGPFGKARQWYKQFYNPREMAKGVQEKINGVYVTKGTSRDPF
ncbi:MAG: Rieske 2Fe-2S domain-containing protein [Parvibaculales bacterium]